MIYGKLNNEHHSKGDEVDLDWAHYAPNIIFRFFGFELYWQPVMKYLKDVDLVIVEQANKLLINYILMFRLSFYS